MKRDPKEKFVTLYDTAKKCILILDRLYGNFESKLSIVNEESEVKAEPSIITDIYISALGLIDYFHRFNEIVSAMLLIRNDQRELKRLGESIAPVKECRNYLQHMRGGLMTNDAITYPVLGAISWIEKGRNYVLFSNQPTQNLSTPGIAYDRLEKRYVCKYLLVVGGHEIKIDTVFSEVKLFWKWLEKVTVIEPSHIKDYVWGKPTILYSEVTEPNKAN